MPASASTHSAAPAAPRSAGRSGGPAKIGRFEVLDVLGKGAQGIVYRAHDPVLGRDVAVKALKTGAQDAEVLLREARVVGQLKHPNIVPVFEVGEAPGGPFLVCEFVEGETLRDRLTAEPQPALHDAMRWAAQILGALECAHGAGIVHRDLNPRNVRITPDGTARVMDFGVSALSGTTTLPSEGIVGTAKYLAPEQLDGGELTGATDVFTTGLVLYEMLTGSPVIHEGDAIAAMWKIAHEAIEPPSKRNPRVDADLERIVMRALEKSPADRYASADEFRAALAAHRAEESPAEESGHSSTIAFLMRRMRRKKDFPAVAAHVGEIRRKTSTPTRASVNELSNIILKDYALATKLLKLVNSSYYSQYGGGISTISRSVVILGFEQVRMAAMSLLLFDHLDDGPQADELKDSAGRSFLSGALSRELADASGIAEPESSFVCAMLRNLGRYAAVYYLPEEFAEIRKTVEVRGTDETEAALAVLGVTYDDLGVAVAREWQLPTLITDSMRADAEPPDSVPKRPRDAVRAVASYANALCQALADSPPDQRAQAVAAVHKRFERCVPVPARLRKGAIEQAVSQATELAKAVGSGVPSTRSLANAGDFVAGVAAPQPGASDAGGASSGATPTPGTPAQPAGASASGAGGEARTTTGMSGDRRSALINGIQDITNALLEGCSINDVLVMVLETMFRGLGFNRVVFCIADRKNKRMVARFGLGDDIDRVLRRFYFSTEGGSDVFSRAVREGKDCVFPGPTCKVTDIPVWHREITQARSFAIMPVVVNRVTVGMVYCDIDNPDRSISGDDLNYVNTLRNQAALAIKQRR